MKRVLRLLLDAAALLLLGLTVTTLVLWLRSYHVAETFAWHAGSDPGRPRYVYCSRGRLGLVVCENTMTPEQMKAGNLMFAPPPPGIRYSRQDADARRQRPDDLDRSWMFFRPAVDRSWGGFRYRAGLMALGSTRQWVVPFWAPTALLAVPAALAAVRLGRRLRRWRAGPGRCAFCGYDLRATPERCPECGTVPDASA
ncbi:MAG TPA: hypothetical protein VH475_03800 [Tepidisphaeraceae bacterium]